MKTSKEIRVINISYWANLLGRDRLAEKLKMEDTNYINQLCKGHGSFGDTAARKIERNLGLETGWFDNLHPETYQVINEESPTYSAARAPTTRAPVIEWKNVGRWLEDKGVDDTSKEIEWVSAPFNHGPRGFIAVAQGLAMHPEYKDGDRILIDPDVPPSHNDDVVARLADNVYTFRKYQNTPEGDLFIAINRDFPDRIMRIPESAQIIGVVIGSWTTRKLL